ncbi:KAP family P-loop NTPase fold protein [Klebsiella michiganensis]|uniref:KAP family P-loop NTPase fold protein n=1 Tax=Klebsiella michiganensis TaxID=1134687 RepID=UPI00069D4B4E|nr:P-loop NTPase fold protein [Klebsiella michiganensis]ELT9691806.1 NTPase [Klebsiella michiganensis]MCZ9451312.1 KAP family NTPase [Klebsiella michiganensis]UKS44449.1 KAP family NTPase [Klebsiella michiganensis]
MTNQTIKRFGLENMILDKSVTHPDQDRHGFLHIARQLASAIHAIGREGSAVIGIEGAWGSGKTSLLNLLRSELDKEKNERTYVLNVSPWLDGDGISSVETLLLPVARVIADEEEKLLSPRQRKRLHKKNELTESAKSILRYSQATARHLAPMAEFASLIPGVPNAGKALKSFSELNLKEIRKTTAELRTEIAEKIAALDLSFIVLLDDLDRLEPAQAVEIIRLVKSVADFPRFRYIMCYDKAVLAQAIKTGLGVEDGNAYLQKIVQIPFSLPLPESFDLRLQFFDGAVALYESVNGFPPDNEILADLNTITDTFGVALRTPREVQLSLNALAFRYPGVRDYVYLPDLCFLQLIQVTCGTLYEWTEQYLTIYAVVASGDGTVSEEEHQQLREHFVTAISKLRPSSDFLIYKLHEIIPGVEGYKEDTLKLFRQCSEEEKAFMGAKRRLGSSAYWRYYFAFSAPQDVLPPEFFTNLFALARTYNKETDLAVELLRKINSKGITSRTWYEHILSQLSTHMIKERHFDECAGLLRFFFNYADGVMALYYERNQWFSWQTLGTEEVVNNLLRRLLDLDRPRGMRLLKQLFTQGSAWNWAAGYLRELLWQNGMAGNQAISMNKRILENAEVASICKLMSRRLRMRHIQNEMFQFDSLLRYMYAWREIDSPKIVCRCLRRICQEDDGFLNLLLRLRGVVFSSHRGAYRELRIYEISRLTGLPKETIASRLESLGQQHNRVWMVDELQNSLEN